MSTTPVEPTQPAEAVTEEQKAGAAAHNFINNIVTEGKKLLADLEKWVPASLISTVEADGTEAAETVIKDAV
jgi:hypothetical protein